MDQQQKADLKQQVVEQLKKAWRGEEKLWMVFWVYGALVSIIFSVILGIINGISPYVGILFTLPVIAYGVVNCVMVWRCAWNSSAKIWGILARVLVVLTVISQVFGLLAVVWALIAAPSQDSAVEAIPQTSYEQPMESVPEANGAAPVDPAMVQVFSADAQAPEGSEPAAVPPAAATAPTGDLCEQQMQAAAAQYHVDAATYMAQNKAWLDQCRAAMAGQPATP